jgi:hypothetical protein
VGLSAAATNLQYFSTMVLPIRTRDDIPRAIAAAAQNPDARWYVERRVKALKVEDEYPLPWRKQ